MVKGKMVVYKGPLAVRGCGKTFSGFWEGYYTTDYWTEWMHDGGLSEYYGCGICEYETKFICLCTDCAVKWGIKW